MAHGLVTGPDDPFFVVGCARSGTTLLRLMLDSHPELAVPDESHFVVDFAGPSLGARKDPARALEYVFRHDRFRRWGLAPDRVRELAARRRPETYAGAMATVFEAYAREHGKRRWGDKSPPYVAHVALLADLFPTARFVHIIRDGREVATSLAGHRWGPRTPVAGAFFWRARVGAGRAAGRRLAPARYREIRYERLVAEPEAALREVCAFLGERFDPRMLDYPEHSSRRVWSGAPDDPNHVDHRHLAAPPTPGVRDWRRGLSVAEQAVVEAAAQPLLRELGYTDARPAPAALVRAWSLRLRSAPGYAGREAGKQIRGAARTASLRIRTGAPEA